MFKKETQIKIKFHALRTR